MESICQPPSFLLPSTTTISLAMLVCAGGAALPRRWLAPTDASELADTWHDGGHLYVVYLV